MSPDASRGAPPPAPLARLARLGWILPVVVVLGLYLSALDAPFVFDDRHGFISGDSLRSIWPARWFWQTRRPVVDLTFALNWAWTGPSPWSYRLVNVLIHAASAALLWLCVRGGLRSAREPVSPATADALATAVAAVWAAHPLHTSAVTYVVHRYESLAGALLFGTLAAWQRGVVARRPTPWYALTAVLATLAVLSKEIAIGGPLLLVAYEWAYGSPPRAPRWRALAAVTLLAWGVAAAFYPQVASAQSQGVRADLGRLDYLRSELGVLAHYLRLSVAPWPLSVDYYEWPVARSWRDVPPAGAVAPALGALTAWAFLRRAPRLGWLGLVCFVVLAPTSSIVPLFHELAAERRMYVPLAALVTLAVLGIHRAARGRLAPVAVAAALATLGLGALTVVRNRDYRSGVALFSHDLRAHPGSARLHCSLGESLVREQGRRLEAWAEYQRVLALDPVACTVHLNLGALAAELGWSELAERHMRAALRERATTPLPWMNAANFFLASGRDATALDFAEHAVARFPRSDVAAEKLAWVLATARDPAVVDGARSLREAQRALGLSAGSQPPLSRGVTLAAALAAAGQPAEAHALASRLLAMVRRAGLADWSALIDEQARAYAAGQRWIESGRAHPPAPPEGRR